MDTYPAQARMATCRLITIDELESLAGCWNTLAGGVPFRRHEWLSAWWRHYGAGCELYTLRIDEQGDLIGLAPLYLQRTVMGGRVLRLLGDGEVCSDYVGLLCSAERAPGVAATTAEWLRNVAADPQCGWDAVRLEGIDSQDAAIECFVQELSARGCSVHRRAGPNCWRLELPADWAAYEASLSKSHRKQVRRLIDRVFDSGRARLHTVADQSQLERGWQILIDLHQRRRRALGESGCFSSSTFANFHDD